MSILEAAERSVLRQRRGSGWVEQGKAVSMLERGMQGSLPRQSWSPGRQVYSKAPTFATCRHSPTVLQDCPALAASSVYFLFPLPCVWCSPARGGQGSKASLSLATHPTVGDVFTEPRTCLSVRAATELAADSHLPPCTAAWRSGMHCYAWLLSGC